MSEGTLLGTRTEVTCDVDSKVDGGCADAAETDISDLFRSKVSRRASLMWIELELGVAGRGVLGGAEGGGPMELGLRQKYAGRGIAGGHVRGLRGELMSECSSSAREAGLIGERDRDSIVMAVTLR